MDCGGDQWETRRKIIGFILWKTLKNTLTECLTALKQIVVGSLMSKAKNTVVRKKQLPEPITSKNELKKMTNLMRGSLKEESILLLRMYFTKNWNELGYESFKGYLSEEIPELNYDTVLSWVSCDKIAFELAGESAVGVYSLNAIRLFKVLSNEQRKKLWESLKKSAKKSKPSGSITRKWLTADRVNKHIAKLFVDTQTQGNATNETSSIFEEQSANKGRVIPVSKKTNSSSQSEVNAPDKKSTGDSNVVSINKLPLTKIRSKNHKILTKKLETYDVSNSLAQLIVNFSTEFFDSSTVAKMITRLQKKSHKDRRILKN
jgi:hypothetical protein